MNIYQDLEDSLYNIINTFHPDWTVLFAYTNASEPVNPYVSIDVRKIEPCGREYSSTPTVGEDGVKLIQTTIQDYETSVRFEFIGKYDDNTTLASMADLFQLELRTSTGYELQTINRIALHKLSTLRRLPLKRDTDMYMIYQLDCVFAYSAMITVEQDYAAAISGEGVYYDANQPPDYTMKTQLEITLPT